MKSEFTLGDAVMLKSGGPKLTVISISNAYVGCVWLDGPDLMAHEFVPETLTKYTENE